MKRFIVFALLICFSTAEAYEKLIMSGPPIAESCPMMLMAKEDALAKKGLKAEFRPWMTPDHYRALISSGSSAYIVVSTLEYVRLGKILDGVRLMFSVEGSPLWIMGHKADIELKEIENSTVALPFRGDMPEILMDMLMDAGGLDTDTVKIVSAGNPVSSAQLVMTGRADYVAVPEPMASNVRKVSIEKRLTPLEYSLSVADEWKRIFPDGPPLLLSHLIGVKIPQEYDAVFSEKYLKYQKKCTEDTAYASSVFADYFPFMHLENISMLLSSDYITVHSAGDIRDKLAKFTELMERYTDEP